MKNLTYIILLISMSLQAQNINLKLSKTDKAIIRTVGISTTIYGFARIDKTANQLNQSVIICVSGILFAALPDLKFNRLEINSSGINFKLREKRYKCKTKTKYY